jgi:hypothetical protein
MQVCLDAHAVAMYIASYMLKSQKDLSKAMRKALDEAKRDNTGLLQSVRKVGNAFVNSQEMSAQEAAYLALGLNLRTSSRASVFVTTNEPNERTRILKPRTELDQLEDNNTNIFAQNLLDKYAQRPAHLQHVCLADYATWYTPHARARPRPDAAVAVPRDGLLAHLVDDLPPVADKYAKRGVQRILRYRRLGRLHDPEGFFR